MAGVEVGPNDIVIHLVNPYRCGDCGAEFFLRTAFLEHVAGHMATLKAEKPCHQIVCVTTAMEHAPKGITVTRDILQINDQQLFELQDPYLDYTQLSPLKALEQAGILKLPSPKPPKPTAPSVPFFVASDNNGKPLSSSSKAGSAGRKRQVSLLKQQQSSLARQGTAVPSRFRELSKELVGEGQLVTIEEGANGEMQYITSDLSDPKAIDKIVQQAMLEAGQEVKVEDGGMSVVDASGPENLQDPLANSEGHVFMEMKEEEQEEQEKFITGAKKRATLRDTGSLLDLDHRESRSGSGQFACPTPNCHKSFSNAATLRRHRQSHQKQFACPVCHRGYQQRAQLMFHMRHHDRKRFIQFGSNFHEVRVVCSRNGQGQVIQEHYLLLLLSKEEQHKVEQKRAAAAKAEEGADLDKGLSPEMNQSARVEVPGQEELSNTGGSEQQDKLSNSKTSTKEESYEMGDVSQEDQEKEGNGGNGSSFMQESGNTFGEDQTPSSHTSTEVGLNTSSSQLSATVADSRKKVIYKCGHCKKVIFTRPALSRHLIKHTNTKPFQCDKCLKSFSGKGDLMHHYKTHTKPVHCPMCRSSFSKSLYLRNHLVKGCPNYTTESDDDRITVLEDLRCLCNVCQKVLKSKMNAIRHLRIHDFQERSKLKSKTVSTEQRPETSTSLSQNVEDHYEPLVNSVGFQCTLCGEELRFRSFMVTHVRKHLNQRLFKCDQCPKSFFARHMLRKHQQNHTRPYKCPVCGKGFIRRYMMTQHFTKRHDLPEGVEDPMQDITELPEQQLIQCDICGKTMRQSHKSVMLYHIRLHKDVRPYSCDTCGKAFISDNALKKHSLTHSKPYVCQVCGTGFSRRYLLTDHFKKTCIFKVGKTNSGSVKVTSQQGVSALTQTNLSVSTQSENLDTEKNEWQVIHTNGLGDIGNIDPNLNEYFCEPCSKKFTVYETYLRHIRTFSKPTVCKYCQQLFEDKHSAIAHQRSCLGVAIPSRASTDSQKTKSLTQGEWQERVKLMEEVNKTIQTVSSALHRADGDAESQEANQSSSSLSKVELESDADTPTPATTVRRVVDPCRSREGKFSCPQCERTFTTARGLKIHASTHIRLFKCEVCDVEFKTIGALRSHSKKHRDSVDNSEEWLAEETQSSCKREYSSHNLEEDVGEEQDKSSPSKFKDEPMIGDPSSSQQPEATNSSFENTGSKHETLPGVVDVSPRAGTPKSDAGKKKDSIKPKTPQQRVESIDLKLMQSGTRGRPYRCLYCRKRFTQQEGLDSHMVQSHTVEV